MRNIIYMLAAVFAFATAYYYYKDVSAKTATVPKMRLISEDGMVIEAGTVIDEAFLEEFVVTQPVPASLESEFRWALDDTAANRVNLRNLVFQRDVNAGSFLERSIFFTAPEEAFALRIAQGHRAFSIPVASRRAVENFIAPESRVDVIGTFEGTDGTLESRTLLENVAVMAVGTYATRGEYERAGRPGYNSVTLQAPDQAVATFLSRSEQAVGDLTLVLRNPCEDPSNCVGGVPEVTQ